MAKLTAVVVVALALAVAACGGDPDYCSEVGDLEQSVKDLGDVDVVSGGTNAVRDALRQVQTDAQSTIDAAKSDFPDETSALRNSIDSLKQSAGALGDSPTRDKVAPVVADVKAVGTSVAELVDATASKCD